MTIFFAVVVGVAWVLVLVALGFVALDYGFGGHWVACAAAIVAAVILFAYGVAVASSNDDPHPDRLCVRGHQEWRGSTRAPMLVGKVWVCIEWEAR